MILAVIVRKMLQFIGLIGYGLLWIGLQEWRKSGSKYSSKHRSNTGKFKGSKSVRFKHRSQG